jgi:cation-transporting ATPase E
MDETQVEPPVGLTGLTEAEAVRRRNQGQGNNVSLQTSRSYAQIFRENLFTFINAVFFALSLVLLILGRPGDAVLVAVVIFGGVIINIYQEIWAKQKLDQIALLNRPRATVVRDRHEREIDPSEIVLGDLLVLRPGDQIVVDGAVVGTGRIEVDESLLTGESDLIPKTHNDPIYSGSFCVSGTACYEAEKVGTETVAYQLMVGARAFRQVYTPLQQEINLIIRVCILIACFLWILIAISFLSRSHPLGEVVQRAAVVAGLVPAGLLLAITLSYGMGAVRMVGQDVLIQQANAVESLSNVDVLCLDKTGTLTTNQIVLESVLPIEISEVELRSLLGDFAASTTAGNRTSEAIAHACPGKLRSTILEVPFSSARRWSGLSFDDDLGRGSYVLGAPEALLQGIELEESLQVRMQGARNHGLRVVVFGWNPAPLAFKEYSGQPDQVNLPASLSLLGVLFLSDQLRPEAYETLQGFAKAGIEVKIISGDNPQTVAALAKQAGLEVKQVVSGTELDRMDAAQIAEAAKSRNIFGRITPEQKAALVRSLRSSGRYVAMIGDGVNDVLSLKQANLAIAMESGSKATRGVADIVLMKDSFGALPQTFLEGQRIRSGILDVMKLFMVRLFVVTLLIFSTAIVTDSFPFENKQSAIVTLIGVGLPTIFIPIWAKPSVLPRRSMVRSMLHFTVPATLTLTLVSLLVYLLFLVSAVLDLPPARELSQVDYAIPRSALVTILVLGELCLIPFLKPPTTAWVGGEPLSGDCRYSIMALLLLGVYVAIVAIPPVRDFFELSRLGLHSYLYLGLVALEWCLILRFVWRTRFLDRFLGVDLG